MATVTMLKWYDEAAEKFIKWMYENTELPLAEIENIKANYKVDNKLSVSVRNVLRAIGYSDNTYGDLTEHYEGILELAYEKVGIE